MGRDPTQPKKAASPKTSKGRSKPKAEKSTPTNQAALETASNDALPEPPKKERKKTRDAGRDEALSEYLASLGGIPLLTADQEKELARDLRDAEAGCWTQLLRARGLVAYLSEHPVLDGGRTKFLGRKPLVGLLKALKREPTIASLEGKRKGSAFLRDLDGAAHALRAFDEDQSLIEEVVGLFEHLPLAEGGQRDEALEDERDDILDFVARERRRALRIRNHFVRANLRLVVSVARRFHHYRMPLIDLIQEGNLGLIKSVHRFDDRKGFRFSTYAHWWIRQAIERAIMNKGAQVRLPVHIFDARREVAKATRELAQGLGRDPSHEELAEALCLPIEKLEDILKSVPREPMSLDDPIGDDEDRTVAEVIADAGAMAPDEHVILHDDATRVRRVLRQLTPMEIDIIERRFGLCGGKDETLEEIGRSYNLSRERVRQIQVQGLKKMQRFCEQRVGAG